MTDYIRRMDSDGVMWLETPYKRIRAEDYHNGSRKWESWPDQTNDRTQEEWVRQNNWPYRPLWPKNFTKNLDRALRGEEATEETDHHLHEVNRAGRRVALAGLEVRRQRAKAIGIQLGPLEVWWSISRSWWEARAELKDALSEYEELIKGEKG